MIVELNAFGCTKYHNIEPGQNEIHVAFVGKNRSITLDCQTHESALFIETKTAVFEWLGDINHENIRIYYLTSIK